MVQESNEIGCSEASVGNYHYTLRGYPKRAQISSVDLYGSTKFFHINPYATHIPDEEFVIGLNCVFRFSLQLSYASASKNNCARYDHKCTVYCSTCTPYSCRILMSQPQQILDKYLDIKFHENSSKRSRIVPCRPTHGYRQT